MVKISTGYLPSGNFRRRPREENEEIMTNFETFLAANHEQEKPVVTKEDLDALVERVKAAQQKFSTFSQKQVDHIFRCAALAASDARIPLAKLAVEETGMGVIEDKVIKNHFASEYIYNSYKDEKTCGILSEDDEAGTITIAEPMGVICGLIPTTNPTSTAIFKALISLKTRNGIIISPHPRASAPALPPAWC
jgi:acetaldehyde dehydrogenase/alcohol dehydrogenase